MGDTVVASGYGARRQAGAGRFLCSPPRTRRGHLWFAGPSYMRSMWNASEISGLEKDPAMPTTSASVLLVPTADGPNTKINIAERGTYLYSRT